MTDANRQLDLDADVLVIGGGLAGTWAAVTAARAGASVVLVDKGCCGTSGVTATAGPGHWWVAPDPPGLREEAIRQRDQRAFGLADPRWMERIIDLTWRTLPTLAGYYRFTPNDAGVVQYRGLRGPEYMRAMRRLTEDSGVRVLDHSPALELLLDDDETVAGAQGVRRQTGEGWRIAAGAVVIATGGCAFKSRLLGCHTNTGDGYLMAAEVGGELSGMEFTNYYTAAPARSTMTRSMAYSFARYLDAEGRELDIPAGPEATPALARALSQGKVFCILDRIPEPVRRQMPQVQPNFMLPFDRLGVDPYSQAFEITLHGEGTVRGIGGLRVVSDGCETTAPGLFAAGDAATRELVAGATSGGGAQNSAWALSSGQWAGAAAAVRAAQRPRVRSRLLPAGRAGLRPGRGAAAVDTPGALAAVQREMLGYDRNMFRSGPDLEEAVGALDAIWRELSDHALGEGSGALKLREVAAMVASARWSKAAALARRESRGMHQRLDTPAQNPGMAFRQHAGGLDQVWTRFVGRPALVEAAG